MEYKGYTITALVKTTEEWELDEYGRVSDYLAAYDGVDVFDYIFKNEQTNDEFWYSQYIESDGDLCESKEELQSMVDEHLERKGK